MIRIEMLPASYGDCLFVEYGEEKKIKGRLVIDGGPGKSAARALQNRLAAVASPCPLDLLVVTHIDGDHIEGILNLLSQKQPIQVIAPEDVWFNGYDQVSAGKLGAAQGEDVSFLLEKLKLPWNTSKGLRNGIVGVSARGALPEIRLAGGATVTLLSPGPEELDALVPVWKEELRKAGLRPGGGRLAKAGRGGILGKRAPPKVRPEDVERLAGPSPEDDSPSNGSSIAFILAYGGKRMLFAGDAHPSVLEDGLRRYGDGRRVPLAAFKVPHHGSRANLTRSLLALMNCKNFLFSTDGKRFGHPDPEAICRILVTQQKPILHFNARSDYTSPWKKAALRDAHDYRAMYPGDDDGGPVVQIC